MKFIKSNDPAVEISMRSHQPSRNLRYLALGVLLIALLWTQDFAYGQPVSSICPGRFALNVDGHNLQIPYCSNYSLEDKNEVVERAVIVIHGADRNAIDYYGGVLDAAKRAGGADTKTVILAPQLLLEEDIRRHNPGNRILFWGSWYWTWGNKSHTTAQYPRPARISSFSVIDIILQRLSNRNIFPNLKKIVIAGHSAGGQFVNRFAAGSQMEQRLVAQFSIQVRYIISNPSSYLYFNEERRVEGTLDKFAVPSPAVRASCPKWNDYGYGLRDLNSYMQAVGIARIREQYRQREVIYLLGSEDNDPNAPGLDKNCPAMLQGLHRFERGLIYYNYIQHYYGPSIVSKHTKVIIPNVGHNAYRMVNSACGIRYLFDYGECR